MLRRSIGTIVFAIVLVSGLCSMDISSLARGGHRRFHGTPAPGTQASTPVYLVIDISEVVDSNAITTMMAKVRAALVGFGGRVIVNSDPATALDGAVPGRLVIIAFDNPEKIKAWNESADAKDFNAVRRRVTKSLAFMIDGLPGEVLAIRERFDSKPYEELIKKRDEDLKRFRSICKGC